MTTSAASATADGLDTTGDLHTFTVEQYMALDIPDRTELLEGLIYDLSPKNAPHSNVIQHLTETLVPGLIRSPLQARFEQPIAVSGWNGPHAPEIDVAIIRRKTYVQPPTAADAIAFIEISDTTYGGPRGDRTYKIPLYLTAGVPSWIVNIPLKQVEQYADAAALRLAHGRVFRIGESFEIAGVTIAVAALFPPEEA
jgi:hypothetical protein